MGLGEAIRDLPKEFRGELPGGLTRAEVFCGGCLVVEGAPYSDDPLGSAYFEALRT